VEGLPLTVKKGGLDRSFDSPDYRQVGPIARWSPVIWTHARGLLHQARVDSVARTAVIGTKASEKRPLITIVGALDWERAYEL
jgi:hypothetical protein